MKIQAFGYTDIGDRVENEDSINYEVSGDFVFGTVCDGLGGHGDGKAASSIAVKYLSQCSKLPVLPNEDDIHRWLEQANQEIFRSRANNYQMKTTVTFACVRDGYAIWSHLGDSRIYHFHNGRLAHFTNDHSVSQIKVVMGEITREQIPECSDRSKILRVLGIEEIDAETSHEIPLSEGQNAFLLCSDGFWEYLKDAEIEADLCKSETPEQWINYLRCRKEQRKTDEADNNSAVAFFVDC